MSSDGTLLIVCHGSRYDKKKKEYTIIQQIMTDYKTPFGECATFIGINKGIHGLVVNGIYEIQGTLVNKDEIDCIKPTTSRLMGEFSGPEAVANRLKHDGAKTLASSVSQAKKLANDRSNVLDCMEPLRRAYNNTNSQGKMALEVRVLHYLRYGKDL